MPPQFRFPLLALLVGWVLSTASFGQAVEEAPLVFPSERAGYETSQGVSEPTPAREDLAQPLAIPFARQVSHAERTSSDSSAREASKLPPRGDETLSLAPPTDKKSQSAVEASKALPSFLTVLASLSAVLGVFFLFAWMVKKSLPKGTTQLPNEVVEMLGRTLLAPRQYVHLLRVGNKLLLVSMSPAGTETLTEITDPLQVDRLAGLCQKTHPFSSTNAFRQIFQQFGAKGANKDLEIADPQPAAPLSLKSAFEQSHV